MVGFSDSTRAFRNEMVWLLNEAETILGPLVRPDERRAAATVAVLGNASAAWSYHGTLRPRAADIVAATDHAVHTCVPHSVRPQWQGVVDELRSATSHLEALLEPQYPRESFSARVKSAAMWPQLALWVEHGVSATDLLHAQEIAPLLDEGQMRKWTHRAAQSYRRGLLVRVQEWHSDTSNRRFTIARVHGHADHVLIEGDLDSEQWRARAHCARADALSALLPPTALPRSQRPDPFHAPRPGANVPLPRGPISVAPPFTSPRQR